MMDRFKVKMSGDQLRNHVQRMAESRKRKAEALTTAGQDSHYVEQEATEFRLLATYVVPEETYLLTFGDLRDLGLLEE